MIKRHVTAIARRMPFVSQIVRNIDHLHSELTQCRAERDRFELIVNGGETGRPDPRDFEEQIYSAVVKRGDLAFDVGANLGNVARYLARLVGSEGKVLAFEPVWPTYEQLCRRLAEDARTDRAPIICLPFGAAESDKTAEISVPDGKLGEASLAAPEQVAISREVTRFDSFLVRFIRLDEFAKTMHLPIPDFVKIDVEGAEKFVLEGATEWLSGPKPPIMLIELFAPWQRMFNYKPWAVLNVLKSAGYEFFFQCPAGLVMHAPTEATPFPPEYVQGYNLLVLARDKHPDQFKAIQSLLAGSGGVILPMYPSPVPNLIA